MAQKVTIAVNRQKMAELKANVRALLEAASIRSDEARRLTADAAQTVARSISEKAAAARTGSDIQKDIFWTRSTPHLGNWMITQLAGIRKRGRSRPYAHNYREWRARTARSVLKWRGRRGSRRIAGARTVSSGQLVGMSLAKMFERGTSKMRPRPFFGAALAAGRWRAYRLLEERLRAHLVHRMGR